ncbi:MAG: hypothetical protein ACR2PV_08665 [Gammaproteobacteria bacterium]
MAKNMTTKSDAEQKIWNVLAEMAQETKEARRESRESSRRFEKQLSELAQETKDARRERLESSREFYSGLKAIREEYGGYTKRESIILEDEFLSALQEKKQVGNIHLDYVRVRVNNGHEYDLVGINGGATVVGEIKRHFRVKDVKEFVGKVSQHFAQDFPEYARPKIYGMVAGESITEAAAVSAKKCGLFILCLKNKALVVENSKNAKPIG